MGISRAMIVCSCNVLSDRDVQSAVGAAAARRAAQVYSSLGCRPQCGHCVRTIRNVISDALRLSDPGPAQQ
jgi:bacterioferritin-associated ferredoxin